MKKTIRETIIQKSKIVKALQKFLALKINL